MKKTLLLTLAALSVSCLSMAQREGRTRFSIGPELGVATSNPLKDISGNKGWGLGVGASLQADHFFRDNLTGNAYAGVISYAGRSNSSNSKNKAYTVIPVRVGGDYYPGTFHIGAQIGVGINSMSGASATAFAYSPQVGLNFSKNERPLDLTLRYDGYAGHGNFSALNLRLSLIL